MASKRKSKKASSDADAQIVYPHDIIDRKLYQYHRNIEHATECLTRKAVYLTAPSGFNDPFDACFIPNDYTSNGDWKKKSEVCLDIIESLKNLSNGRKSNTVNDIIQFFQDHYDSYQNQTEKNLTFCYFIDLFNDMVGALGTGFIEFNVFQELVNEGYRAYKKLTYVDCKITCFSEVKDSILMWAYYTNNHKGVCIEFAAETLDLDTRMKFSRVHYSPLRADRIHKKNVGSDVFRESYLVSSKSDVWSHELEWRIARKTDDPYFPMDCISAVYLGYRFQAGLLDSKTQSEYRAFIEELLKNDKIKVYGTILCDKTYGFKFQKVSKSDLELMLKAKV